LCVFVIVTLHVVTLTEIPVKHFSTASESHPGGAST
jgi:hypothetical protein